MSTKFGGYEQNVGRPSKEKSPAELPTINKTDTRKELAKLSGDKNSLTLPKSDKSINKVNTTDELARDFISWLYCIFILYFWVRILIKYFSSIIL